MSSWIGITTSAEAGQPSFFEEDFSHILQEHGFNDFVNLLGIADHTHFNTFQSLYIDPERSCSTNPELYEKSRSDYLKDQNTACDESDSAVCLLPSLSTSVETPKQSRDATPDRLDYVRSPRHSAFVEIEAKRRRLLEPQFPTAEEKSGTSCFPFFYPETRINRVIRLVPQDRSHHRKIALLGQELRKVQLFLCRHAQKSQGTRFLASYASSYKPHIFDDVLLWRKYPLGRNPCARKVTVLSFREQSRS